MCVESWGVQGTPLYLLSKGEKTNRFLCVLPIIPKGDIVEYMEWFFHCCTHKYISVYIVPMVTNVRVITSTRFEK